MVDKVMHMQHVAAGEDARDAGLQHIIDLRAGGQRRDLHARALAELILRNETDGEQQRIAVEMDLTARNRTAVFIDLGDGYAGQALLALDIDDGMAEIQRNIVVIEALNDIAVQAGRERHQLGTGEDLRALQRHAAGHDQADIAGAEDHDALAGHIAHEVDVLLRSTGGINTGAAGTRRRQRATRTLAAAHRQDDRLRLDDLHALRGRDTGHQMVFAVHRKDSGIGLDLNAHLGSLVDIALGVFGAGQLLLEAVQTKAVVDALA